jgi:outer membrane murein-binding lipoprotein Lpp
MRMIFGTIAAAVALAGCVSGPKVDNTPVAALDLNRYLGEWYEIARFDHSFERGVEQAKANYTQNAVSRVADALASSVDAGFGDSPVTDQFASDFARLVRANLDRMV